ncbi:Disease resistance protein L6 [Linum perenne]
MDMWSFFWALVAFFLALAVYFHLKKSSRITNATTSSQPEPSTKQQSSASSSSNTPVSVEYEVFLSFRGPDVRTNFADFLHKYLVHTKIRTFLDDEDLRKGEKMAPSLVKAIKESKVYIPILSPDYASSKWCLQELSQMVKCCKQGNGHIILPIFYMMEPRDVRHQEGYYKKAFRQHMKKFDAETINEWKEALKEVGEMEGWSVKESDRQGAVIDQVFSKVWSHLTRDYMLVTDDLIGIDLHVENMKGLLQLPKYEAVKVIGIHGMGGIGKTTVAKALYNEVCAQFERFCFLEDVRETLAKPDGVVTLQKRIISSILRVDVDTKDANEGINVIRNRICKLKVFVVLDDADDSFKFDEILGKLEDFCLGSRFIITTRDKRVVEFFEEYEIYELGEMGEGHSLELFSRHAFGVNYPPKEYSDVSMKFVKAAAGLPLALKVIGSLLFRKDISFWEAKLEQLKDILPSQVQETLRISYLELTHEERQIFLDICCVFRGEEKELPFYMWSDCGFHPEIAITILIQRSLIKINKQDEKNVFWMHDHTRDLGRTIVREEDFRCPWKRSRIWSNEDALDMLTYEQVAHKLKSISLVSCQSLRRPPNLSQCQNLEMIHFSVCRRMRGEFSILNLKNLKELDLICTKISKLTGDTGMLQKLQEFNPLEVKLRELPAGLCKLSSLECLRLTSKDSKLKQVPALPTSLKRLYLSSPRVPNLLDLNNLEELEFYSCHDPEIPGDIWKLSKLKTLKLWVCRCKSLLVDSSENEMSALPVSLRRLVIYCCTTLERLPNLSNLSNLTDLVLTGTSVHEIPGLGEMRMLETLKISHSPHISNLDGLEQLTLLKTLSVRCEKLEKLPSLMNLTKLDTLEITHCPLISELHGICKLVESLLCLTIINCPSLAYTEGLGSLQLSATMEQLLPSLSNLSKLRKLFLSLNQNDDDHILSREQLFLGLDRNDDDHVLSREQFLDLSSLCNLNMLSITRSARLTEVCGFERLQLLESLHISCCSAIRKLPNLSGLKQLKKLDILECVQLSEVMGLENLESLQELSICNCTLIKTLPDLSCLKQLQRLDTSGCTQLTQVTGIEKLKKLKVAE